MQRRLLILLLGCLAAPLGAGHAATAKAFSNAYLDGSYAVHDLFALPDETGVTGTGARTFDGDEQVLSLVTYALLSPMSYEVATDGRLRLFRGGFDPGFVGAVGLGGGLAVYAPSAGSGEDSSAPAGYEAFRLSVRKGSGYGESDFRHGYSYHALVYDDEAWWNIFGAAEADGAGRVFLYRPDTQALGFPYSVDSNGQTNINSQGTALATLTADGDLLFQTVHLLPGRDPRFLSGYAGLAVYVRRDESDEGMPIEAFSGTYRVHELQAGGGETATVRIGQVSAGGGGVFFGTLGGDTFNGRIALYDSGVFRFQGDTEAIGTLGVEGEIAVVTLEDSTDTGWMQLWVRIAGGSGTETDTDGDGLTDLEEIELGTDPEDSDTDDDGLLDGSDPHPLVADNDFEAALDVNDLTITEGGPDPAPLTLTLDSDDFPFFEWSVTSTVSWMSVSPGSGEGDATVTVTLDTSGFTAAQSPYNAQLKIDAPNMQTHPPLDVRVTVLSESIELTLSETSLNFVAVEGGLAPLPREVTVGSSNATDFDWEATYTAEWLTVEPDSGEGETAVSVRVDVSELTAAGAPYTASVQFAPAGATGGAVTLSIEVDILGRRDPGVAFAFAHGPAAQAEPALAYGSASGAYFAAWTEVDAVVYAAAADAAGAPRIDRLVLSLASQGPAARPTVTVDEATHTAWVIWEQRLPEETTAFLQARTINLDTGARSSVFGVAPGTGSHEHAAAVYDADRNTVAVAYQIRETAEMAIALLRIDAGTKDPLGTTTVVMNEESQPIAPDVAYSAPDGRYLVVWSMPLTDEGETLDRRIWAQEVDAVTGDLLRGAMRLDDTAGIQSEPRAAYSRTTREWTVLWRAAASSTAADFTMRVARFEVGAATPAVFLSTANTVSAGAGGHDLADGPESSKSVLVWQEDDNLVLRRMTADGYFLGAADPFPSRGGTQRSPALAYNGTAGEFFAVWREEGMVPPQIYAMRIDAGSAAGDEDEDGLPNDWEAMFGLDPLSPEGDDGADGDPDRDGLTNLEEYLMGTSPVEADTDGDGLWDRQEDRDRDGTVDAGETGALEVDTDGDGAGDGTEWFLGTDGTDEEDVPGSGIVRLAYGTWTEGVTGELEVHVFAAAKDTFTLELNAPGWQAPAGWTTTLTDGRATQTLEPGEQVFTVDITPTAPATAQNSHGLFAFRLSNESGLDETRTAILVVDGRTTGTGTETTPEELALAYAPVVRLHRDEFYRMTPIEFTLDNARFSSGNTQGLAVAPEVLDLFQSPQTEARVDLIGTTVEELNDRYGQGASATDAVAYYTVTQLGARSAEEGAPETHVALQYYLHFFADEWGVHGAGGHRHEGDWELLQVLLDDTLVPYRLTATQQVQLAQDGGVAGGASIDWDASERMDETHPVVYAGAGGHSLYFEPGATAYGSGTEWHDGLGDWAAPATEASYLVTTDYPDILPLWLEALPRLSEAEGATWLRYAGLWGQAAFPAGPDDSPTPSTRNGALGPVFLGNTSDASSPTGVRSVWGDPYAWSVRTPDFVEPPASTVLGVLPEALTSIKQHISSESATKQLFWERHLPLKNPQKSPFEGGFRGMSTLAATPEKATAFDDLTVALADARGRLFRFEAATDGSFALEVPPQTYTLAVVTPDTYGWDTLVAVARFDTEMGSTPLFPTTAGGTTDLGTFTLDEGVLIGSAVYATLTGDDDWDDDGVPNASDDDALGDGWDDAFQAQDPDDDGIPSYYDEDDDGDGTPDIEDSDANGNGVVDTEDPVDTDGDGFIDAIDLDWDNDGFTNDAETLAGSNPYHFLDTPLSRIGDLDGDGDVDVADGQWVVNMALKRWDYDPRGDFDLNGAIDALDLQSILNVILEIR